MTAPGHHAKSTMLIELEADIGRLNSLARQCRLSGDQLVGPYVCNVSHSVQISLVPWT